MRNFMSNHVLREADEDVGIRDRGSGPLMK